MSYYLDSVKVAINSYMNSINSDAFNIFIDDFSFGKMLRSKLILSIAKDSKYVIDFCAIVELIHFASLLHDDVIDNSNIRRGKISINSKYGDKSAIMLGDILYSKAFYEISLLDKSIATIISNAVLKLSLGELEDVNLGFKFNDDETKYFSMIEKKTASLIEASAYGAGILIGEKSNKYKIYGNYLGISFQIIDDLLDITKDDNELGKSSFSDFKEGKSTLPYIFLYHSLDIDSKKRLLSLFKQDLDSLQKQWIKDKMEEFNIIDKVKNVAISYGNKAISSLNNNDAKLIEIMQDMIFREF